MKVTYAFPGANELVICFREESGGASRPGRPPTPRSRLFAAKRESNDSRTTLRNLSRTVAPTFWLAAWALRRGGARHVVQVSDGSVRAVMARTGEVVSLRTTADIILRMRGPGRAKLIDQRSGGFSEEERLALEE